MCNIRYLGTEDGICLRRVTSNLKMRYMLADTVTLSD